MPVFLFVANILIRNYIRIIIHIIFDSCKLFIPKTISTLEALSSVRYRTWNVSKAYDFFIIQN